MEGQAFDTLTWSTSVVLSAASLRKKIQCIVCGCMCVSRCVLTVNQILNIVLLDWLHINKVGKKNLKASITMAANPSLMICLSGEGRT